jgi:hypothetical protein
LIERTVPGLSPLNEMSIAMASSQAAQNYPGLMGKITPSASQYIEPQATPSEPHPETNSFGPLLSQFFGG